MLSVYGKHNEKLWKANQASLRYTVRRYPSEKGELHSMLFGKHSLNTLKLVSSSNSYKLQLPCEPLCLLYSTCL